MGRRRGRVEPYAWLGAGAITLGIGAALTGGAAVANADGTASDGPASSSSQSSANDSDSSSSAGGSGSSPASPSELRGQHRQSPHGGTRVAARVVSATADSVTQAAASERQSERDGLDDGAAALDSGAATLKGRSERLERPARVRDDLETSSGAATGATGNAALAAPAAAVATPLVANIPVGNTPTGVAVDPSGTRVYVSNSSSNTVSIIDMLLGQVIATIPVGSRPSDVALGANGTRAYVTNAGSNTVSVLDTTTHSVVASIPVGPAPASVALSPNGTRAYIANAGSNTVSVINTASNAVIATIAVGLAPAAVVVSPNGSRVYVASWEQGTYHDGSVSVIDAATNTVLGTPITVANQPTGIVISPNGSRLYVVHYGNSTVSVINTANNAVIATPTVGAAPWGAVVSPDGKRVYVTARYGSAVSVIDTATNKTVGQPTRVGVFPTDIAISPNGDTLYVANGGGATVSVINLTGISVTVGAPDPVTGVVRGKVLVGNPANATLTFKVAGPKRGKVTITGTGEFTYTPTAGARHAASATGAGLAVTTDTFTVTVTGGPNGKVRTPVTVSVSPVNVAPAVTVAVKTPDPVTGVVTGTISGKDPEKDKLTFVATGGSKGSVTVTSKGVFTYTPSVAAQFAAGAPNAGAAAKSDVVSVLVTDGHGGATVTSVTVAVAPLGAASNAEGLLLKLASTTDTIYAEKIQVGKKTKMVVYMTGINFGANQSTIDSLFANAGLLEREVANYIDQAYLAFGKPSEIQLVGHSNGGQQMQAYELHGTYRSKVTSVVVFGAPLTAAASDFKGNALAILNHNDPVPLASKPYAYWNTKDKTIFWHTSVPAILGVYPLDFMYHDASSYQLIARMFDQQASPNKTQKALQAKIKSFGGVVKDSSAAYQIPKLALPL